MAPPEIVGKNLMQMHAIPIREAAKIGKMSYELPIPITLYGYPSYNVPDVAAYLADQFNAMEFEILNYDSVSMIMTIGWHHARTTSRK